MSYLEQNRIYCGDCRAYLKRIEPESISLSFWSPPYWVGKPYETGETYEAWQELLKDVIDAHTRILKPGGFMVINIADILSFKDAAMPKIMGLNPAQRKCNVTRQDVLNAQEQYPGLNRRALAELLDCSEQTIDRRLNGNNIRGGRYSDGTRVKLVGGNIESYAYEADLYLYDKRIWKKDPAWANSRWTVNTLKAVSETEDIYTFWKPGEYLVNRERLSATEWKEWGLRQIWEIPSVRRNDAHPAMFPLDLATRVIRLYTDENDAVLDPFLGSGTTAVAAVRLGRKFIGIEKDGDYFALAARNLRSQSMRQLSLV